MSQDTNSVRGGVYVNISLCHLWAVPVFFLVVACAACTQESSGGVDGATPIDGDAAGKTPVDASVEEGADAEPVGEPDTSPEGNEGNYTPAGNDASDSAGKILVDASVEEGADANPAGTPDAATPADGAVGGDTDAAVDWGSAPVGLAEKQSDACPTLEPPYTHVDTSCSSGSDADECQRDVDCAGQPNGFCYKQQAMGPCRCGYHLCQADADCSAGQACQCFGLAGAPTGNTCLHSCRSSAECAANERCTTTNVEYCGSTIANGDPGYRCGSPADACRGNQDCGDGERCFYSDAVGHFACGPQADMTCE